MQIYSEMALRHHHSEMLRKMVFAESSHIEHCIMCHNLSLWMWQQKYCDAKSSCSSYILLLSNEWSAPGDEWTFDTRRPEMVAHMYYIKKICSHSKVPAHNIATAVCFGSFFKTYLLDTHHTHVFNYSVLKAFAKKHLKGSLSLSPTHCLLQPK